MTTVFLSYPVLQPVVVVGTSDAVAVPKKDDFSFIWGFKSIIAAIISILCSGASIMSIYGLSVAYPDTLQGPVWILSLIAYAPFLFATMMNRESLSQIYLGPLVTLGSIWIIIPINVGLPERYGLPFGIGFSVLMSVSLHVWLKASSGTIDFGFISRFVCFFMVTAYVVGNIYGILVSVGIQFYRAPFLLQPIVVFGFSSLEATIIFINSLLAWSVHQVVTKRSIPTTLVNNPILYLVAVIAVWCALAGIITATQNEKTRVTVSTMGFDQLKYTRGQYDLLGRAIGDNIRETGSQFVVLPETFIKGDEFRTCEEVVETYIAPQTRDLGAYVSIGCLSFSRRSSCQYSNFAITLSPRGSIVSVYGKMRPTPGEESCTKRGYFSHDYTPINGGPGFKFSPLICYDMDYINPAAESADLGSSLILNPSNDWGKVRHHFAASVIKAVENRVAVVKAEMRTDAAIIDPFGNIAAFGGGTTSTSLTADIPISEPLKVNWFRQHAFYWIFHAGYMILTGLDIFAVFKKRRTLSYY